MPIPAPDRQLVVLTGPAGAMMCTACCESEPAQRALSSFTKLTTRPTKIKIKNRYGNDRYGAVSHTVRPETPGQLPRQGRVECSEDARQGFRFDNGRGCFGAGQDPLRSLPKRAGGVAEGNDMETRDLFSQAKCLLGIDPTRPQGWARKRADEADGRPCWQAACWARLYAAKGARWLWPEGRYKYPATWVSLEELLLLSPSTQSRGRRWPTRGQPAFAFNKEG